MPTGHTIHSTNKALIILCEFGSHNTGLFDFLDSDLHMECLAQVKALPIQPKLTLCGSDTCYV